MKVLFLGPASSPVLAFLRKTHPWVYATDEPIDAATVARDGFTVGVSHGYRHRVGADVLQQVPVANLHISLLPWNRGADPNLWSWAEDTPKGVSIHWMDAGIDTGPIIAQQRLVLPPGGDATLRSTYSALQFLLLQMFAAAWPLIRDRLTDGVPQPLGGSAHRKAARARLAHLLSDRGWDTPVADLESYAADAQMAAQQQEQYRREASAPERPEAGDR